MKRISSTILVLGYRLPVQWAFLWFLLVFILLPTSFPYTRVWSQEAGSSPRVERVLEISNDFDPLAEIVRITSRSGEIQPSVPLSGEDDWFKGLAITIRNDSKQPVTHILLDVRFPRPIERRGEIDFSASLSYGESPVPSETGQVLQNTARPLLPGESTKIELSEKEYKEITTSLRELGYPSHVSRIRVTVYMLGYSDGTIWMGGRLYRFDTQNPGKLIPIKKRTMPGKLRDEKVSFRSVLTRSFALTDGTVPAIAMR